jgi:hypothetical protein
MNLIFKLPAAAPAAAAPAPAATPAPTPLSLILKSRKKVSVVPGTPQIWSWGIPVREHGQMMTSRTATYANRITNAEAKVRSAQDAADKADGQLQEANDELVALTAAGKTGAVIAKAEAKVRGAQDAANEMYFRHVDAFCELRNLMKENAAAKIAHLKSQLEQAKTRDQNALIELLTPNRAARNEIAKMVNAGVKLAVAGAEVAEIETQLRNADNDRRGYILDAKSAKTNKEARPLEIAISEADAQYQKARDKVTQAQRGEDVAAIVQAQAEARHLGTLVDNARFRHQKVCDKQRKQNEKMAVLTAKINTELRRSELVEVLKQEAEANLSNNDQAVADLEAQVDNAKNAWLAAWDELDRLEPPYLNPPERITEKLESIRERGGLINDFHVNLRYLDGQGGSAAEVAKKARAEIAKSAPLYEANTIIQKVRFEHQLEQATAGSAE